MAAMMTKKKIVFLTLSVVLMTTLLAGAVFGQATQRSSVYRYLSIFSEVFELVRSNYVESPSSESLMEGAFNGVTDAIDEFSYYVPPAQMAAYKGFRDVEDNGLGMVVTRRFGYAYVVSSLEGSPAEKAGVEAGDFIEKIDGRVTSNMAVWQVRTALQAGKPVRLALLRGGETARVEATVAPAEFHPVGLRSETISGVGYVKVPYFEPGSASRFRSAVESLRQSGVRKLIVDLRGNAGGSVEEAIAAADDLLTSGLITGLQGRRVEARQWQADRATTFDGEVQVLTDNSTASGAEIFAAAMRGNGRGKVVGVTTYGKAIHQKFVPLPSGGGVQLTVAHYTAPDGKPILDAGIRPDVTVDLSAQALSEEETPRGREQDEEDRILEKALHLFGVEYDTEKKKAA